MRQPGTYETGVYLVPEGATGIRVSFDRTNLSNVTLPPKKEGNDPGTGIVFRVQVEMSINNGGWFVVGGVGAQGGDVYTGLTGTNICTETVMHPSLPEPQQSNRRIRATAEVLKRLRTGVELEWTYA
jgi:hypothetical protein